MRIEQYLETLGARAIEGALGEAAPGLVRPTQDQHHGDYQLNGVLPLAKRLKRPPRDLAALVAERLRGSPEIADATAAGPGFVNVRLRPEWVATELDRALADANDGIDRVSPEKVVVDFSSPNIAKQMHVGHLRSTILGDAIVRCLRAVGHDVVGDNHLGDWGTQFGLLIAGMRRFGDDAALAKAPIDELERIYKLGAATAKEDAAFADEARAELAKLQAGDPENRGLWERFVATTRVALDAVYAKLGVTFDEWLGESAYDAMLPSTVALLQEKKLVREDEGALCVFWGELEGAPADLRAQKEPFIVRKKDGAFLYSTSDVATILYRRDHFHADRSVYVVDVRQSHHFKQLFALARMLGISMRLEHVGFGTVLDESGKPLKTRDGKAITLASLLAEAEERARARIVEEGLDVPPEELDRVARAVGIGAVKYADLRQNRLSDYAFDWDKMISFKGNAGPYLQYAHARIRSIFRKGGVSEADAAAGPIVLAMPEEVALGKALLRFAEAVHAAAETSQPHLVCDHVYAVARLYSSFYEACPVLKAEGETRASRLALSALSARQLRRGLGLLGIEAIDRM